jgi:drug/metabolite transporter (DMT)-like permease
MLSQPSTRPISHSYWRANLLLTLTAAIWGFAFVAQRAGMEHVQPFTFNAIRFAIGGLALFPLLFYLERRRGQRPPRSLTRVGAGNLNPRRTLLSGGLLAGTVLFAAATLQQMGIVHTTAGKAGFITGLYVVLVPILGLALGYRTSAATWIGIILATDGLYLLSVRGDFTIGLGDFLVLVGAFLWAAHILVLSHFSPRADATRLALIQFMTCALLSLIAAVLFETITLDGIGRALTPILYAGIMSVGVGYTLQVFSQRQARPSHVAILLSLESVFALFGGWLLLNEQLPWRALVGCVLMLAGILVSQLGGPE